MIHCLMGRRGKATDDEAGHHPMEDSREENAAALLTRRLNNNNIVTNSMQKFETTSIDTQHHDGEVRLRMQLIRVLCM